MWELVRELVVSTVFFAEDHHDGRVSTFAWEERFFSSQALSSMLNFWGSGLFFGFGEEDLVWGEFLFLLFLLFGGFGRVVGKANQRFQRVQGLSHIIEHEHLR